MVVSNRQWIAGFPNPPISKNSFQTFAKHAPDFLPIASTLISSSFLQMVQSRGIELLRRVGEPEDGERWPRQDLFL